MENTMRYLRTGLLTLALGSPFSFGAYAFAETKYQLVPLVRVATEYNPDNTKEEAERRWRECNGRVRPSTEEEERSSFKDCNNQYNQERLQAYQQKDEATARILKPLFCDHSWRTGVGLTVAALGATENQALELIVMNHQIKTEYCQ